MQALESERRQSVGDGGDCQEGKARGEGEDGGVGREEGRSRGERSWRWEVGEEIILREERRDGIL